MPATYEPIASTTLGGANTTITFSSIPQIYTDLRIIWRPIYTTGNDAVMRFNGISSVQYSTHGMRGNSSAATGFNFANTNEAYPASSAGLAPVSTMIIDIFSYTGSTQKTWLSRYAGDTNNSASANVFTCVGLWRNTAAITSISLLFLSGSQQAGTIATLYGILKA